MGTAKPIVKETLSKDIQRRSESPSPAGAGRALGEETRNEITPDRIRLRAYEIYQARNGAPGDEVSDWLQAEAELNAPAPARLRSEVRDAGPVTLQDKSRSEARRPPAPSTRRGR
ncbi:MAG: DUF2934 domain-containing protein [Phycisphaerales bacterium JB039]